MFCTFRATDCNPTVAQPSARNQLSLHNVSLHALLTEVSSTG